MSDLLQRLNRRERRGSKPRCHLLTHGLADEVAARLTSLAAPFARVSADDRWMPQGFDKPEEAQLNRAPRLLDHEVGAQLGAWWLAPASRRARTPNFGVERRGVCLMTPPPFGLGVRRSDNKSINIKNLRVHRLLDGCLMASAVAPLVKLRA